MKKVVAPILRAVAAAVTLGTGASLGPEGPSVDIGRSVAKRLGTLLRSQQRRLIPLLAAGSGAGALITLTHVSYVRLDGRTSEVWLTR